MSEHDGHVPEPTPEMPKPPAPLIVNGKEFWSGFSTVPPSGFTITATPHVINIDDAEVFNGAWRLVAAIFYPTRRVFLADNIDTIAFRRPGATKEAHRG